jgi:hypothetical protein
MMKTIVKAWGQPMPGRDSKKSARQFFLSLQSRRRVDLSARN